jgi:hypothetical protein
MNLSLWAYLTIIALVAVLVFATLAFVFVAASDSSTCSDERRSRKPLPGSAQAAETRTDVG